MLIAVSDIFRTIQRQGTSSSLARMICHLGEVTLNGKGIDFCTEVDVNEGDVLVVPRAEAKWTFHKGEWVKSEFSA